MKHEDAEKLKSYQDQKVMHSRYGECVVKEVIKTYFEEELIFVLITPTTENGRDLLRRDFEDGRDVFFENSANCTLSDNIKAGAKPIDIETAWGTPESDMPKQESEDHFALQDEELPG